MAFKLTLWVLVLTFVATIYNVVEAYSAMGSMNVQDKFEQIGLLDHGQSSIPIPPRKPALTANKLASL